jgi:hypothetical protein
MENGIEYINRKRNRRIWTDVHCNLENRRYNVVSSVKNFRLIAKDYKVTSAAWQREAF